MAVCAKGENDKGSISDETNDVEQFLYLSSGINENLEQTMQDRDPLKGRFLEESSYPYLYTP